MSLPLQPVKQHEVRQLSRNKTCPLTAYIETRTSQDASILSVTHQVVSRLLLGAAEIMKGDADDVGGHYAVGAVRQTHPVQCPVQRAGGEVKVGAECACGCQTGASAQGGILGGDHCNIWVMDRQG